MVRTLCGAALVLMAASTACAQCNCNAGGMNLSGMSDGGMNYGGGMAYGAVDYSGMDYLGAGSVGASEPLFEYDDQEPWKHGYLQVMPFYGGYHSGRPYNYHHVFSQTQTSVGWGMPHGMAYSQQWWHRYESMADPGRALTEPNGYYGQVAPGESRDWQNASAGAPVSGVAPVQFQAPAAPQLLPAFGPGPSLR
jgi:hypothetical protein